MKRLIINYPDGTIQGTGTLDEILLRLAAYEDTGLEPEEVLTALEMADLFAALRKLNEYQEAEAEGRLLILPCKVGDVVYITGSKYRAGRWETWVNTGKFRLSDLEKLGKTVFLAREEAEAALKGGDANARKSRISVDDNRPYGGEDGRC